MSRQNKLRKKESMRQVATHEMVEDKTGKMVMGQRKKGPRSTTPKHGRTRRFVYSEPARSIAMRKAGLMSGDGR